MNNQPDLTAIKNLILDMDGVLWHGETAVPGLLQFFAALAQREIAYILATNNATKTLDQYVSKLTGLGLTVPPERILTSSLATAAYLSNRYPPGTAVYVIGERGLRQALKDHGLRVLGRGDGANGETAVAVVIGLDRTVHYDDLAAAVWYISQQEAQFVATNADATLPTEQGPMPGAGALVAAVQVATNVTPLVIGKPAPYLFNEALRRLGSTTADTAMVGDRLTTDIAGAQAAGLPAILLLSGVTDKPGADASGIKPDWTFTDLAALTAALSSGLPESGLPVSGSPVSDSPLT